MGAWGIAAWENDTAADWFGDLFDSTGLAKNVEETLNRDPEEHHEEIRAAAYLLVALGRVYIWPINELENHLVLAITKLEEIKRLEIYQTVPAFIKAIDEEIGLLKSRQKPYSKKS
jgi:hypothetical protein